MKGMIKNELTLIFRLIAGRIDLSNENLIHLRLFKNLGNLFEIEMENSEKPFQVLVPSQNRMI